MEKYLDSCSGDQWFDSQGLHNRVHASIDRDCINLLGSKQVVSRARILRGAQVEKNMRPPTFHGRIRAQLRFTLPTATYLKDVLSGVSQNEVSFGKNENPISESIGKK